MKTRCPDCQTIFRISADQLKARAGQVRCGHCRQIFNAFDNLLGVTLSRRPSPSARPKPTLEDSANQDMAENADALKRAADLPDAAAAGQDATPEMPADGEMNSYIPERDRWTEELVAGDPFSLPPEEKPARWPYVILALLLLLALTGQLLFYFRAEIAVRFPATRSTIESISRALGVELPLPRHAERISLEASDLQKDSARQLLVLSATLRNQAEYAQAYPELELTLTDTQDSALARRIIEPANYLPPAFAASQPFAARSDVPLRLWIDAGEIAPAGYRLFVFYP